MEEEDSLDGYLAPADPGHMFSDPTFSDGAAAARFAAPRSRVRSGGDETSESDGIVMSVVAAKGRYAHRFPSNFPAKKKKIGWDWRGSMRVGCT